MEKPFPYTTLDVNKNEKKKKQKRVHFYGNIRGTRFLGIGFGVLSTLFIRCPYEDGICTFLL